MMLKEIAQVMMTLGRWMLIIVVAAALFVEQINVVAVLVCTIASLLLVVVGLYLLSKHRQNERLLTESNTQ